jgi:hypothetical protein
LGKKLIIKKMLELKKCKVNIDRTRRKVFEKYPSARIKELLKLIEKYT